MNKKVVGGLFAVLFVTQMAQTGAILKMQKVASAPRTQNVAMTPVQDYQYDSNQQAAAVISSQKTPSIVLEEYLKSKYPKDHLTRIQRINSKVEALLVANGLNKGDTAVQKSIFHRIWCGLMGMNVYQENIGGGIYCAKYEIGLPYALPDDTNNPIGNAVHGKSTVQSVLNSDYLKNLSSVDDSKILTIYDGIEKILRDEGVDTKALGGPGFRRFLCRLFGGTWSDEVVEYDDEMTVWVQSCLW